MPIILDYQLREQIPHNTAVFPVTFYCDELSTLPNCAGPLHWHPYFEIATAKSGVLDYQVGQDHIILESGDSIFVNSNMLHGIRQVSGDIPDPMPNIVFSGTVIAPETSTIYQTYIHPIVECDLLPFIVFKHNNNEHDIVNQLINEIYYVMHEQLDCYEMLFSVTLVSYLNIFFVILIHCQNLKHHAYNSKLRYVSRKCYHISMSIMPKRSLLKI